MPPLISIVIAAYNAEDFIAPTIRSVLGQSYPNLELIVVDDGSTDDTAGTVKKLVGDALPLKIFSAINGGQNAARNIGLALTEGSYVKFLDHDDILTPWAIETQHALLEQTGEKIAIGGIERFEHEDAGNFLAAAPSEAGSASEPDPPSIAIAACETYHPTFNEILIHRDLVVAAGGFNPALGTCEELNLLGRIHLNDPELTLVYQEFPTVLYKRCMDWSLAAHHRSRSKSHVNWALVCRTDLAKDLADREITVSPIFRVVVLDKLYQLATISYRNGLKGHALSAIEAWKCCDVPRPKLEPLLHERLHSTLGFEKAERLLAFARVLIKRPAAR